MPITPNPPTEGQAQDDVRAVAIRYASAGSFNTAQSAPSSLRDWLTDYRDQYPRLVDRLATGRVLAARMGLTWNEEIVRWDDQCINAMVEILLRSNGPALAMPAHEAFASLATALQSRSEEGFEIAISEIAKHLGPRPHAHA